MSNDAMTDKLNELLRGEIAATETYQQALAKVGADLHGSELRQIRDDHRTAANSLRLLVRDEGEKPHQGSGTWGAFAKAVEGTAKLFGNSAAIKALKEGEEYGVRQYEMALANNDIPGDCRELIELQLLPQTRSHIDTLDRLLAAA